MSLILTERPVLRVSLIRPVASSGVVVVGKTRDNRYEIIQRYGAFSPYVRAYEVDISDHHDVDISSTLPSMGDVFEFRLRLILDWKVTSPVTVVERQVAEGLPLCTAHLVDLMRDVTRLFPISSSAAAEAEVRRVVGSGPVVLPEGITIYQIRPQLSIDDATRSAGHARATAEHEGTIAVIKGRHAVTAAHNESNIKDFQQRAELLRMQDALEAIQSAFCGNYDPIALHLAQHPDQTRELVEMIRTDFKESQQRRDALIVDLAKQDLIQDIDITDLTSSLLTNAAAEYQTSPQPGGNPQIIRGVVTNPDPSGTSQSTANGPQPVPPAVPADETTEQPVGPADDSGVAGWRRVPPRPAD